MFHSLDLHFIISLNSWHLHAFKSIKLSLSHKTHRFLYIQTKVYFKNHLPLTIPVCFLENTSTAIFQVGNCGCKLYNLPGMTKSVWFTNFCYRPRYLYFSVKSVCGIQIYIAIIVRCMIFLYFFSNHNYHIKRFKLPAKFEHNFETYDSYCIK